MTNDNAQNLFEENKVKTESIKCSSCGSNMVFNPDTQCLYCEHCDNSVSFVTDAVANEIDITAGFNDDNAWKSDEASIFSCDNCGARVVLKSGETATACPFCGTAHVTKKEELIGLKPNALIPFAFGQDKAIDFSKTWAKKKLYAPTKFKKNLSADNVKGVYTPCFTFDSYTQSHYVGRIGKTYTRTVGSGKYRRVETYVVWRDIMGTYYDNFDDVLISAGSKIAQDKLDKISPYDTNLGKVYNENYMLGFMAYHYDYELSDCWGSAKSKIDSIIKKRILSRYHYDKIAFFNVSTTHQKVTYKYVMLPVFVGNFNYGKKIYNFFVNGSTGKVAGKTPKSVCKILFTIFLGVATVAGIALACLL